jgi:hypothetical protein
MIEKRCSVCGSTEKVYNKTIEGKKVLLCQIHRERFRHSGTFHTKRELKYINGCKVCGEKENITETNFNGIAEYYCRQHYMKLRTYGDAQFRTRYTKNEIIEHEDNLEVLLYDKDNNYIKSTFLSKEHKELISQYKWRLEESYKTYYASAYVKIDGRETTIKMHQIICNKLFGEVPEGFTVDHVDRNGLNNLNENLRYATFSEQQHNKSLFINNTTGVKGVTYHHYKKTPRWVARIGYNKKRIQAYFDTFEEAKNQRLYWEELITNNLMTEYMEGLDR